MRQAPRRGVGETQTESSVLKGEAVAADKSDVIAGELQRWLELAQALRAELEKPEPDARVVQGLLARQQGVQERLATLLENGRSAGISPRPQWSELARAVVEEGRRVMELAGRLRAQVAARLREVWRRQEMATGYRRALVGAIREAAAFVDRLV